MPPRITGVVRRDDTIARLGGDGDNFYLTWAADDSQLMALCDGGGFEGVAEKLYYNSHLFRMTGSPETGDVAFGDVPGYPRKIWDMYDPIDEAAYYGFATLAVDGAIYQFMSTHAQADVDGTPTTLFVGSKLIYSPDGGVTWYNQDGSTPVVFERAEDRSRENMVFFKEPGYCFALPGILQMSRDYSANTDGYVYLYAPNGITKTTMNELVLARMPKDRILDRGAYEYFAGFAADGSPRWSSDIADRRPVHAFPEGYVTNKGHPYSWQPSIVYNEPLDTYLMTTWGMPPSEDDWWFIQPSYLGFWSAPTPWGPWTQIHEDTAWTPGGDEKARCYQPQISPKWISEDGRSIWIVWTDYQNLPGTVFMDEYLRIKAEASGMPEFIDEVAKLLPYYAVNAQRVDLLIEAPA
jgi:hypothetical protein